MKVDDQNSEDLRVPEPESDEEKEVYAFYGHAAYWANVLERGIQNLAVVLQLGGVAGATSEVENLFDSVNAKTMGAALRLGRSLPGFPADLEAELAAALSVRNRRATSSFHPRQPQMQSRSSAGCSNSVPCSRARWNLRQNWLGPNRCSSTSLSLRRKASGHVARSRRTATPTAVSKRSSKRARASASAS